MNPPSHADSGIACYTLRLKGHLDDGWACWFDNLILTRNSDGTTTLCGVVDQAALHGILRKVRDTGIVLISVMRVEPGQNVDASTGGYDEQRANIAFDN